MDVYSFANILNEAELCDENYSFAVFEQVYYTFFLTDCLGIR